MGTADVVRRAPGSLRVIGGRWRSRIIEFQDGPGVRPTPDRVRQTLFDWLAPRIQGAVCVDLFAGSGALGIEALSRGAGQVTFVERARPQAQGITGTLARFDAGLGHVVESDVDLFLARTSAQFEIAFVDPPYVDTGCIAGTLLRLQRVLKAENRVYLEWPDGQEPTLPEGWYWLRQKQAGQVSYGLATYDGELANGAST